MLVQKFLPFFDALLHVGLTALSVEIKTKDGILAFTAWLAKLKVPIKLFCDLEILCLS